MDDFCLVGFVCFVYIFVYLVLDVPFSGQVGFGVSPNYEQGRKQVSVGIRGVHRHHLAGC